MVYLPPLLSTSQSPRLHTCLPPHLLYVKPSVSRSNCTAVTNAAGFFLYLRLAPTGTPCLLRFIASCPESFSLPPVHRMWHSWQPCHRSQSLYSLRLLYRPFLPRPGTYPAICSQESSLTRSS